MDPEFEGRVIVVANRLPITIKADPDGNFEYNMSSGGLVSGLKSLAKAVEFKWFGWPGIGIHRNDKDNVRRQLQDRFDAVPIFLNSDLAEKHYNGFSSWLSSPLYSPYSTSDECQTRYYGPCYIVCPTESSPRKAGHRLTKKSMRFSLIISYPTSKMGI